MTGSGTFTFGRMTDTGYQAHYDVSPENAKIQAACCKINDDKTFEINDLEFEAAADDVINLLFRQPSDGIMITEIYVTYL